MAFYLQFAICMPALFCHDRALPAHFDSIMPRLSTVTSGPGSGRLRTSATSRCLAATTGATCTLHEGHDECVGHLCGQVSFRSATNLLDFSIISYLGLLAVLQAPPQHNLYP